jgi:hypothetical protein
MVGYLMVQVFWVVMPSSRVTDISNEYVAFIFQVEGVLRCMTP